MPSEWRQMRRDRTLVLVDQVEVTRLLRRQDGVVSRRQVRAAGGTDADIDRLVRRRVWVRIHPACTLTTLARRRGGSAPGCCPPSRAGRTFGRVGPPRPRPARPRRRRRHRGCRPGHPPSQRAGHPRGSPSKVRRGDAVVPLATARAHRGRLVAGRVTCTNRGPHRGGPRGCMPGRQVHPQPPGCGAGAHWSSATPGPHRGACWPTSPWVHIPPWSAATFATSSGRTGCPRPAVNERSKTERTRYRSIQLIHRHGLNLC